ncbi:MAG TPA: hypothetical protein VKU79_01385 [Thermoplasmataceae archaeon]|nr:hypothetical protein [Thermoplasmataceae archaeon]
MSKPLGSKLPGDIITLLSCNNDPKDSVVALATADQAGFPHFALLSPYQVIAPGESTLYVAVYDGTASCSNLLRTSHGTLLLFHGGGAYYIKGSFVEHGKIESSANHTLEVVFRVQLREVLLDRSEIAPIISEPRFSVKNVRDAYTHTRESLCRLAGSTA